LASSASLDVSRQALSFGCVVFQVVPTFDLRETSADFGAQLRLAVVSLLEQPQTLADNFTRGLIQAGLYLPVDK
jgi:hypothetical protein